MSIVNQLCRQLTGISIPCDLEQYLVDYIKTFNGNDKVFKLLNIIDCKFKDQFCDNLCDMTIKQLHVVRKEMDIRPCNIVGTGVKGNVRREDLIRGITGRYLDTKYEQKFREFTDDNIFSPKKYRYKKTKEFYTYTQMKVRLEEFKSQFITEQTKNHICMIRMIQEDSGIRSNHAELYIKELIGGDYQKHDKECCDERRNYHRIKHKKFEGQMLVPDLGGDFAFKVKINLPEIYETRNQSLYNTFFNMGLISWRLNRVSLGDRYYCFK